jgi:hypothetical protein
MEILAIERAQLGIQQFERFASRRNDDILAGLRSMRTVAKLSNTLWLNWIMSCPDPDPAVKPWIVEWPKFEAKTNVSLRLLLPLYRKSLPPVPVSVLVVISRTPPNSAAGKKPTWSDKHKHANDFSVSRSQTNKSDQCGRQATLTIKAVVQSRLSRHLSTAARLKQPA